MFPELFLARFFQSFSRSNSWDQFPIDISQGIPVKFCEHIRIDLLKKSREKLGHPGRKKFWDNRSKNWSPWLIYPTRNKKSQEEILKKFKKELQKPLKVIPEETTCEIPQGNPWEITEIIVSGINLLKNFCKKS